MNLKVISKAIYIIFLTAVFLEFNSCSENPIVSEGVGFDSARYDWEVDTIEAANIYKFVGIDTNHIYYLNEYYSEMIYYNGKEYIRCETGYDFDTECINALDENNVYVGGYGNGEPYLVKWNGSSFSRIDISGVDQNYRVESISFESGQILWLGTHNGRIIRYDGEECDYYYFDSTFFAETLIDKNGNIYALLTKVISNPEGTEADLYLDIYKYENNLWNKVYSEIFYEDDPYFINVRTMNQELYGVGDQEIYKFMGTDFHRIIEINEFDIGLPYFGGTDEMDLLTNGFLEVDTYSRLFHWNGKKWSKEILTERGINNIKKIQSKFFCAGDMGYSALIFKGICK